MAFGFQQVSVASPGRLGEGQGSSPSLLAPAQAGDERILSLEALAFVGEIERKFSSRLHTLLERRKALQARLDGGEKLRFLAETQEIRDSEWTIAGLPPVLQDRRVEITGPVDRKMIINALNSGANVFMADFEDSTAPTWRNIIDGQKNLIDAVSGNIRYIDAESGKSYSLNERTATLMVRPRGLHLPEKHLSLDGKPMRGAFIDFGLFAFHNAKALARQGKGPFFYLPKLESHHEALLWDDIISHTERKLGLAHGTIKVTVLIETLPAAFEMDEILYALKDHIAGLNCGRWDYIFSFIKKHRRDASRILPDRAGVTMEQPFLKAYSQLLIRTCHRRGAHAMGGMAAQIPIKTDMAENQKALDKVRADKLREVRNGHDGTWVAHPGLVPIAREIFDAHMPEPNQLHQLRNDVIVQASDLLEAPAGPRTMQGLSHNIRVGIQYLEAWLRGMGCVPLYNLMEDAATAEISRAQIWQWVAHRAPLDNGDSVTPELVKTTIVNEMNLLKQSLPARRFEEGRFEAAMQLFENLSTRSDLVEFLTLPAYELLTSFELNKE